MARYQKLTVILEDDTKDEYAQPLIAAISQMRGVARVVPGEVTSEAVLARLKVVGDIRQTIYKKLDEAFALEDPVR